MFSTLQIIGTAVGLIITLLIAYKLRRWLINTILHGQPAIFLRAVIRRPVDTLWLLVYMAIYLSFFYLISAAVFIFFDHLLSISLLDLGTAENLTIILSDLLINAVLYLTLMLFYIKFRSIKDKVSYPISATQRYLAPLSFFIILQTILEVLSSFLGLNRAVSYTGLFAFITLTLFSIPLIYDRNYGFSQSIRGSLRVLRAGWYTRKAQVVTYILFVFLSRLYSNISLANSVANSPSFNGVLASLPPFLVLVMLNPYTLLSIILLTSSNISRLLLYDILVPHKRSSVRPKGRKA